MAVIIYTIKKQIKWKTTLKIAAFGLLGTAVGWFLLSFLETEILSKCFGGLVLILGIKEIFSKKVAGKTK